MSFASPAFVFFLALGVCAYAYFGPTVRNRLLVGMGLFWYALFRIDWPLWMLAVCLANFLALKSRTRFGFLVMGNVAVWVVAKAGPAFLPFQTPYGTSFFFCLLLGQITDRWRKLLPDPPERFADFVLSVAFFPLLMGGPIERASHLLPQLRQPKPFAWRDGLDGALIFAFGFGKYTLIYPIFEMPVEALLGGGSGVVGVALGGLLATARAYTEFSSYCDMGRGAARCFGIYVVDAFRPFYYARNPGEFWQRWNLTLGTWIRDYVSLPLMLRYGRIIRQELLLFIAFLAVGLWHGTQWHWIVFGAFNGAWILAYYKLSRSPLASHRSFAPTAYLMLLGLCIGNGILQRADAWQCVANAFPLTHGISASLFPVSFLIPFAIFLAVDFAQEARGKADFFLDYTLGTRVALALAFFSWFFYTLSQNGFPLGEAAPPAYFNF